MAYTTGFATTAAQALDGIQAGAIAGGWTLEHRGADTGGGTTTGYRADILWVTNGTYCLGFSFNTDVSPIHEIQCYWASSFNDTLEYTLQAGFYSLYTHWAWMPCRKWHVFASSDNLYVVIEGTVNGFRHLGGGSLIKQDNYVGGGFLYSHRAWSIYTHIMPFQYRPGVYDSYAVRVAGDGYTERWRSNIGSFPDGLVGSLLSDDSLCDKLLSAQTNQFNRQTVLVPLYTSVIRSNAVHSPIGYPPNIRACNVKYLDPAGETIALGADSWMTFPIGTVGSADPPDDPSNRGLAYFLD